VKEVFQAVLLNKRIQYSVSNDTINTCYTRGWLHRDSTDSEGGSCCVFPTQLHAMYIDHEFISPQLNFLLVATLHIVSTQITLSLRIPSQHGHMNFRFLDDTGAGIYRIYQSGFLNQELVKVNLLELSKVVFRHFSRIKLSEACAGARCSCPRKQGESDALHPGLLGQSVLDGRGREEQDDIHMMLVVCRDSSPPQANQPSRVLR